MKTAREIEDYPYESRYLGQEPKDARYYIAGKGVCVSGGGLFWFPMPPEDMSFFSFDEPVLNNSLESGFTPEESRALGFIQELDRQAQEVLLHVVMTKTVGGSQYAVFYSPASGAYFQVDLDEIDRVTLLTASLMSRMPSNRLDQPYEIHMNPDGVILLP